MSYFCYRIGGNSFVELHERMKLFLNDNPNIRIISFSAYIDSGKHCALVIVEDKPNECQHSKLDKPISQDERPFKQRERKRGFGLNHPRSYREKDDLRESSRHRDPRELSEKPNMEMPKKEGKLRDRFRKYRFQTNAKALDEERDDEYYNYQRNHPREVFRKDDREKEEDDEDLDNNKYPSYRRR